MAKRVWIVMLYQASQPKNVITVGIYSTKREAHIALHRMISKQWSDSVVENTFRYGEVIAAIVEAQEETTQ